MATATLTTHAKDKSTYGVTVAFTDESGNAVAPTAITWTLTNVDGIVINNREDVAVATPAATIDIVLSGDDLDAANAKRGCIVLTVEAIISSTLGNDLPLKDAVQIPVDDLIAV